jgi:threonine dehydratase
VGENLSRFFRFFRKTPLVPPVHRELKPEARAKGERPAASLALRASIPEGTALGGAVILSWISFAQGSDDKMEQIPMSDSLDGRTPLVRLSNVFPDRHVYAKCEFVAPSGSFKIRGACHLLRRLSEQPGIRHLVVPSMGNTALGAAVGARAFGFTMTGVVPEMISRDKDQKLRDFNVELVKIAGGGSDLLRRATEIAGERSAYFVHPHLDPLWTDGYQAIAAEILESLPGCRSLVFPLGGGGLLLGMTEYIFRQTSPITLLGCEPFNYPTYAPFSHKRSPTIADGLVLEDPHSKVRERIEAMRVDIELVEDSAIRAAMTDLYGHHAFVVEPSSAIAVAAARARLDRLADPICVVLTGQNISRPDFLRLIGRNSR